MFRGNPKDRQRKIFMELIEKHEREWGSKSYPGRPTLAQIMDAPVVAAWYPTQPRDHRYTLTIHQDLKSINDYVKALVLYSQQGKLPHSWLWRVFARKSEVKITGLAVKWEATEPEAPQPQSAPKPPPDYRRPAAPKFDPQPKTYIPAPSSPPSRRLVAMPRRHLAEQGIPTQARFNRMVSVIFSEQGFEVKLSEHFDTLILYRQQQIVGIMVCRVAERAGATIGLEAIQTGLDRRSRYGGPEGVIVTTGVFSEDARATAKMRLLRLIDGERLDRLRQHSAGRTLTLEEIESTDWWVRR